MSDHSSDVKPHQLDLGLLSYFVGTNFNRRVTETLVANGHPGVRLGLGFVIQHLIEQPRTATELARRMGVSQQAASKSVKELVELGYAEEQPSATDGRSKVVQLTEAGWDMIAATRRLRSTVEADMLDGLTDKEIAATRKVLLQCLNRLGGEEAIRSRRVQPEDK